jgi:hypothetical protein
MARVCLVNHLVDSVLKLLSEHSPVRVLCAVLDHKNDRLALRRYQSLRHLDYGLENMRVTTLVPSDFIHPHVNDNHVSHGQTKERNLFL